MDDLSNDRNEKRPLSFGFRRKPLDGRIQEENWNGVEAAIRQLEAAPVPVIGADPTERRSFTWGKVMVAAASLVLVFVGIWWIGTRTGHPQIAEIRTGYGEIKNILLPDS